MNGGDARQTDETYDVAISYASEDRPYVQQVAAEWLCQLEVAPGGRLEVAPCDFKLNGELPPRLPANEG